MQQIGRDLSRRGLFKLLDAAGGGLALEIAEAVAPKIILDLQSHYTPETRKQ